MPPSADAIRADFDRIATGSAELPDRVEPVAQRLITEIPLRARVLEIGCGTGGLARELATKRGAKVTAIDLSPRMIDVARVRTRDSLGIEYRVADFMALAPKNFDVAIAVDTIDRMAIPDAASRMAEAVRAGGLVMIADRFDASGLLELPYNGVSWLLRRSRGEDEALLRLRQVRSALRAVLPGVAVRRHLGSWYSAIWHKP